jgi:hypothetical protein
VPAKVAAVLQPRTVIRPAYLVLYLFRPFPHYQRGSLSTRSIEVSVPKLISDDGEKTLLIGPYPVREGTSFNVNGDQMIFHTDRVSTEVRYASLNDCCVLFRGPRHTAAGSEFWKVRAGDRN